MLDHRPGHQRGQEIAVDERSLLVDEEAAIGVTVPGDPEIGAAALDFGHDELPVLGQQRVGLVIGELPVGLPVGLDQIEPEPLEQRPDHRPGHAVAAVDDHLQRRDHVRIDERQRGLLELVHDRDLLHRAAAGGIAEAGVDPVPNVGDPGVARQRERAAPDELRPGVTLGVVRGGAHQAAVEVMRADQEVQHLGRDLAGVEHGRRPRCRSRPDRPSASSGAVRRMSRPRPSRSSPVGLPSSVGDHARERAADRDRRVAVDLVAVDAPDVVRLEDRRVHGFAHPGVMMPDNPPP